VNIRRAFAGGRARRPRPADGVDPLELIRALESSDRFRRDTALGGIFHHGKISFREVSPEDSLHIVIDGTNVSAHLDRISPLDSDPDNSNHYSWARVLAHNISGMAGDLARILRGRHGEHRCEIDCEHIPVEGSSIANLVAERAEELLKDGADEDGAAQDGAAQDGADRHSPTRIPFGLIDEAVHLLDTEAAPWSIQLEARVEGRLDENGLRAAFTQALSRHPMARVRKAASRRTLHQDDWEIPDVPDLDPFRVVDCPDDAALAAARAELQSRPVPLAESPPLRARLARHPGGDVLMLNVNHAAMDGFGALRVLQSVARAYTEEPDPAPKLDFQEARDLPLRLTGAEASTRARRYLALLEKLRDLVAPPARVVADGAGTEAGYSFHHVTLPPSQTQALVDLEHDGTVNDLLLAALHLAIAEWNAAHGKPCGRIGVLVPSNLRPSQWKEDMVGNFSLPARVSTNRASRRSRQAALKALTTQTRRKKKAGMGTALIEVLGHSRLFPLWAKQATVALLPVTGNRLVDTAMLSNLGNVADPPSFGPDAGATVEIWFSPPARMPLGLAIGVVTLGGQLHLSFRYRRRLFGAAAARSFAGRYLSELEGFIEKPGVPARA
jgi:NRPS condensation-like uncharacterized protein